MDAWQIYMLRIGFGRSLKNKQSIQSYINDLLNNPVKTDKPDFILSHKEVFDILQKRKGLTKEEKMASQQEDRKRLRKLQAWWINRMYTAENPLQEKMTLFWHNHFVSSYLKVNISSYMFTQNNLFRKYAFGNFKELTREILYDNAMLIYLDNKQNKAGSPNENLSRELLELFTLGIGNYSETDVKEGARALAGLSEHIGKGQYVPRKEDNNTKIYLGMKGNLKVDDLVEAIFNHPKVSDRITEKLLRYFISDTPDQSMIDTYSKYLKEHNFEIKPLLKKIFSDIDIKKYNGSKIKDPLIFSLQSFDAVEFKKIPVRKTLAFLKNQGMDVFMPPNVKGWDGGHAWLDSGKLIARNAAINQLFNSQASQKQAKMMNQNDDDIPDDMNDFVPHVSWSNKCKTNLDIIEELSDKLIFEVDNAMEKDMEDIVKYDFDPASPAARDTVNQLVRYMLKSPQYQIL